MIAGKNIDTKCVQKWLVTTSTVYSTSVKQINKIPRVSFRFKRNHCIYHPTVYTNTCQDEGKKVNIRQIESRLILDTFQESCKNPDAIEQRKYCEIFEKENLSKI